MDSATEAVIIHNHNNKVSSNKNYIHDDLAFYILSKLPIKSFKRFQCVRKSWSIFLSPNNSHFMTMFRNHFISSSNNNDDHHTFLFIHYDDVNNFQTQFHLLPPDHTFQNTLKLNFPPPFQHCDRPSIQILGSTSVNGILCIKESWLGGDKNKVQFVLWNPATHQSLVLPPSPDESGLPHPEDLYTDYKFHGFGYDKLRDDFKVFQYVTFDCYDSHNSPIFREPLFGIYSLTNNSWRILDIHMPDLFFYIAQEQVYLDGMCHLLLPINTIEEVVFSFDLTNEVTFMTPFDQNFDDALFISPLHQNNGYSVFKRRQLVVLNGSIALISDNDSDTTLQISILGELGVKESWIKLFIIGPIPSFQWLPIGVGKKGSIFFKKEDDELAWLDLSTQIVEEIGVKGVDNTCDIGIYKESLLSIPGLSNY